MTAGRETGGGHKSGIELILVGMGTQIADYGLDVMNLGRIMGILTGTVVGCHHGIASFQKGCTDGAEVGHALTAVAEPCAAVDMHDHGVSLRLLFGQIDVERVIGLVITGIVDITEFLRIVYLLGRELLSTETEATLWLSPSCRSSKEGKNNTCTFHYFLVFEIISCDK